GAVLRALLDPVVPFIAFFGQIVARALADQLGNPRENEIIAGATEDLVDIVAGDEKVLASTAQHQVGDVDRQIGMAFDNDVVAVTAVKRIGAAATEDDIIAGATEDDVVAGAAVQRVVARIAVDRILIGGTGDEDVVTRGATEDDGAIARVVQVVRIGPGGLGIVADHQWRDLHAVDDGWIVQARKHRRLSPAGLIVGEGGVGIAGVRGIA